MPFVRDGELHFLYRCGADDRAALRPGDRRRRAASPSDELPAAAGFRGGSQGVAVDGGHLFVVHEVDRERARAALPAPLRAARRRAAPQPRVDAAFTFTSDRVEFCAGMARRSDELVLSFGVRTRLPGSPCSRSRTRSRCSSRSRPPSPSAERLRQTGRPGPVIACRARHGPRGLARDGSLSGPRTATYETGRRADG